MDSNNKIFAQDESFWNNYGKGRPRPPPSLFDRIFDYHRAKGGSFGTVHDVGAGNGPYALQLRKNFQHVILSDIVPENVELARKRLAEIDGFTFRAAELLDTSGIEPGSVDLVFATNVMHFADPQERGALAMAHQLRKGGTLAVAAFGPARFEDEKLQDIWTLISYEGGRQLLKTVEHPEDTIKVFGRTQDLYNVVPFDPKLWEPKAQRVHLNMSKGGIQGILPPEEAHRQTEPNHTGPTDVEIFEDEKGWSFQTDLAGVKEHIESFPFVSQFPEALKSLYQELEEYLGDGKQVEGYWPATIILATRR